MIFLIHQLMTKQYLFVLIYYLKHLIVFASKCFKYFYLTIFSIRLVLIESQYRHFSHIFLQIYSLLFRKKGKFANIKKGNILALKQLRDNSEMLNITKGKYAFFSVLRILVL